MNGYGSDIGFTLQNTSGMGVWLSGKWRLHSVCYEINWYKWRAAVEKRCPYRLTQYELSSNYIVWPPTIKELDDSEDISPLLLLLFPWLRNPTKQVVDLSPENLNTVSLLSYYVAWKRTATAINLGVTVHGMTSSRELSDILHKKVEKLCRHSASLLLLGTTRCRSLRHSSWCKARNSYHGQWWRSFW